MSMDQSLDDDVWIARCTARMLELDPQLDPELARPIAQDMVTRMRWRSMNPEDAAQALFDFGSQRDARSA
jgi:hypothetical protein